MIVDKIKKRETNNIINKKNKVDIPVGKWIKCDNCKEIQYKETVRENLSICPNCGHYFRMHIGRRLQLVLDEGTYKKFELNIDTTNPLGLEDYPKKIKTIREKVKLEEAVACGTGKINGEEVVICVMDSAFLMGSMGAVVGEKITYSIEKAIQLKLPLIIFTVSGGARMQEGIISLMQMAKTTAALTKLDEAGLLYISVLTDPTYGGVTASFATLRRYNNSRTKSKNWICWPESNRTNNWRKTAKGFSNSRIFIRTWFCRQNSGKKRFKRNII